MSRFVPAELANAIRGALGLAKVRAMMTPTIRHKADKDLIAMLYGKILKSGSSRLGG